MFFFLFLFHTDYPSATGKSKETDDGLPGLVFFLFNLLIAVFFCVVQVLSFQIRANTQSINYLSHISGDTADFFKKYLIYSLPPVTG